MTILSVRELARQEALCSFEYFCTRVLGAKKPEQKHFELWLLVRAAQPVSQAPTETFSWLFGELVEKAA